MRATIVVEDNIVIIDGNAQSIDCSDLITENIHAIQWYDSYGEIEFKAEFDKENKIWKRVPNNHITDFTPYQPYIDTWVTEHEKWLVEQQRKADLLQKMQKQVSK